MLLGLSNGRRCPRRSCVIDRRAILNALPVIVRIVQFLLIAETPIVREKRAVRPVTAVRMHSAVRVKAGALSVFASNANLVNVNVSPLRILGS
jgi:hypothetical protein